MREDRRDFLKTSFVAAAAAGLAVGNRSARAAAATPSVNRFGRSFQVVDIRCRPPIAAQKLLFDMKLARLKEKNRFRRR